MYIVWIEVFENIEGKKRRKERWKERRKERKDRKKGRDKNGLIVN